MVFPNGVARKYALSHTTITHLREHRCCEFFVISEVELQKENKKGFLHGRMKPPDSWSLQPKSPAREGPTPVPVANDCLTFVSANFKSGYN